MNVSEKQLKSILRKIVAKFGYCDRPLIQPDKESTIIFINTVGVGMFVVTLSHTHLPTLYGWAKTMEDMNRGRYISSADLDYLLNTVDKLTGIEVEPKGY